MVFLDRLDVIHLSVPSIDNAYKTLNYENDKAILKKAKAYLTEHSI